MPGHKRQFHPFFDPYTMDITEIYGFDNLHHAEGILLEAQQRAAALQKPLIIAVGNAPTALIRLYELIQEGKIKPELIIGAPVGFVNVVEAKELIMTAGIPYIVPRGRKGGSNIAATICNAMLYQGGR